MYGKLYFSDDGTVWTLAKYYDPRKKNKIIKRKKTKCVKTPFGNVC